MTFKPIVFTMNHFTKDLGVIKNALEFYIIMEEQRLIDTNAGDGEWQELTEYETALRNIKFLEGIYGSY